MTANEKGYQAYVEMLYVHQNPYNLLLEFEEYVDWLRGYREAMIDEEGAIFSDEL